MSIVLRIQEIQEKRRGDPIVLIFFVGIIAIVTAIFYLNKTMRRFNRRQVATYNALKRMAEVQRLQSMAQAHNHDAEHALMISIFNILVSVLEAPVRQSAILSPEEQEAIVADLEAAMRAARN